MFYEYTQNNTGGSFEGPYYRVIVEADSSDESDAIMEANGYYFDGVEKGIDCDCCGDRWHRTYHGKTTIEELGEVYNIEGRKQWGWPTDTQLILRDGVAV